MRASATVVAHSRRVLYASAECGPPPKRQLPRSSGRLGTCACQKVLQWVVLHWPRQQPVTDRFYAWLAKWEGPGQLIILENQEIKMESKTLLKPLEFVGDGDDEGRGGFYPGMPKGTNEASA